MARTVNPEAYAAKRSEILDMAQRLIYTVGYEKMALSDIFKPLKMSSGAFYHYFESKPAVLEALIERIQQQAEQMLLPIVHDAKLTAPDKLRRFFTTLEYASTTNQAFVAGLLRVWFADENAIVREKVYAAMAERRAPLLNQIVRQGIAEGVFHMAHPDQAGDVILALARGMGSTSARLMLAADHEPNAIHEIVAVYAAYADALERILGVQTRFMPRPDAAAIQTLIRG